MFLQSPDEKYKDFKTLSCSKIEELDCIFREIEHTPTGAHIIHIENKDPENLFCLSFRTLPDSSNGIPHILEHTVLCGSENFPVKDPFFAMTRRSLNTFMNAMTGSDFTCYPASSQVEKDFYNLFDIYLDAVFKAKIEKTSFLQEGFRLEFEKGEDSSTPLLFKGIVYNEMKGSLSTGESRMWVALLEEMFPDLPYAYNSGGDPKDIPNLTYEQLIANYKENYHPSRCLFFFYGDLPLQKHLDYIDEKALKGAEKLPSLPPLAKQKRFKQGKHRTVPYSVQEGEDHEKKVMVAFGWLTCLLTEQEDVLALSVLDSILTETDASPLKQALLASELCTGADGFLETEISEVPYVLVCKGCTKESVSKIEKIINDTLLELSLKPFSQEQIDAAIHQIELCRMEIATDHAPFGLTLFFRSALAKQHGCDPENTLKIHKLFDELREKVKDPMYLPSLLKKHFVENTHRVSITMLPDPNLDKKEKEEEDKALKKIHESLSQEEIKNLVKTAKELEEIQNDEEEEDLSCLPKVTLDDIPKSSRDYPLQEKKQKGLTSFHHDCFTNHLLYADVAFDLPNITDEEIPYLQLLLSILPELGAAGRSYKENLDYMQLHTGGINTCCSLHLHADDHTQMSPTISMRGKALGRKADKLLPLMHDMLTAPDLKDKNRIKEKLKQIHTSLQNRVSKHALRYATNLAISGYSQAMHFNQRSFGLSYYHFIEKLMKDIDNLDPLVETLLALYEKVFAFQNPALVLSCDEHLYQKMEKDGLLDLCFKEKKRAAWNPSFPITPVTSCGKTIPAAVAYNVRAHCVSPFSKPNAPSLMVAAQLLENKVLHNKIREIGGAYGSGASYNPVAGCFYFTSYRDPHIASTFGAFDLACETIAKGKFNAQDLEEAKIGIIQQLDTPISPSSRALLSYNRIKEKKTHDFRQAFRESILQVDTQRVKASVKEELIENDHIKMSFAGKELLEKYKELPITSL